MLGQANKLYVSLLWPKPVKTPGKIRNHILDVLQKLGISVTKNIDHKETKGDTYQKGVPIRTQ